MLQHLPSALPSAARRWRGTGNFGFGGRRGSGALSTIFRDKGLVPTRGSTVPSGTFLCPFLTLF